MANQPINQALAGLHDKIKTQLEAEYNDPERVEYELEHMSVDGFLTMLSYIFTD